jgi:competence protein ComFC
LALNALKPFADEIKEEFFVIPIDDKIINGYSHTAVLADSMKNEYLKPLFGVLHSSNKVHYAGKSLQFRLDNPRNFKYTGKRNIDVILVDDITTTGLTLNEAKECLTKHGVNVALSVVLSNLRK